MPLKWKPQHFLGFPFPLSLVSTLHSTFPGKRKNFSWIKNFFFLSPPLPPHFNSDQKTLTSTLSFSLFVWFPGNFHFIHFPSLTFLRKFQSLVLPSLSLSLKIEWWGCWDRRAECSLHWIWSVWREIWEGGFEWRRQIWFLRFGGGGKGMDSGDVRIEG